MSGDRPFAVYEKNDWLHMPEADIDARSGYFEIQVEGADIMAKNINAAVAARERKAAAKALRAFADSEALKDDFGHGEVITKHDVRTALRAEADQVEKGEA